MVTGLVWSDDHGHDPVQEDFAKTGRVGCCKVVGEGSEDDHKRLIMINHDDQGVGLEGPRGSRGGPLGLPYRVAGGNREV